MKSAHRDLWDRKQVQTLQARCEVIESEDATENFFVDGVNPVDTSSQLFGKLLEALSSQSLSLRLVVEHKYEIPASRVKCMHEDIQNLLLEYQDNFSTAISKRLVELGVADDQLEAMLHSRSVAEAMHTTKTQAQKFFQQSGYVSPRLINLTSVEGTGSLVAEYDGQNIVIDVDPDNPDPVEDDGNLDTPLEQHGTASAQAPISSKMHYVPILETLKQYLSHDDVVESIPNEKDMDVLHKFNSGALFESHPVFQRYPKALRIILYMDEFEVCNPIGSSRGLHKILAVYFSIGNIEQHHLSSLSSIHLAVLCEYRTAMKYTHAQVLNPLITDLNTLSSVGIEVTTRRGFKNKWFGALAFIAGDNKTQHEIGGFRGCFNSGRVCRFCMADYSQLDSLSSEADCVLRTPEVHALHLQYVQENPLEIPLYGVTGPSCFSALDVGIVNEMLAPDILHDVLEGVVTRHLYMLMKSRHSTSVLKLRKIINLTSSFKYGRNDKRNKPRDITPKLFQKNYKLVGSASQRWTLFSVFPLAIGPHVPQCNMHWKLFLLAQKICDILFAPVIDYDWLAVLVELVEEHHALWVELYPGTSVFKSHVLLHYARLLNYLGPLRHLWTMRFEAFHQYFIRMGRRLKNFKCITKTLAERFQRRACIRMARENVLPPKYKHIGKQSFFTIGELPSNVSDALRSMFCSSNDDTLVCSVKSVTYEGLRLSVDDFVIISIAGDGAPVFLKITNIILESDNVVLMGPASYVAGWSDHFHSYRIIVSTDSADFICVTAGEVCSPQTLDGYSVNGSTYVKLKFRPANVSS